MTLWIVTTGSSDVELKTDENWDDLYEEVERITEFTECQKFSARAYDDETEKVPVPARALGLVYGSHPDKFESDLQFPLLDVLTPKFKSEIANPENANGLLRVIVLLTDQKQLFKGRINDEDCPFWQDTCELKPIFRWYFEKNLGVTPEFVTLEPRDDREPGDDPGIDHWDEMLTVVKRELKRKLSEFELKCDRENETVYVSHQAGTPAISSAVQFVTISQFKKEVKFLVSNQSYQGCDNISYKAESIPSSNYWRGLQIEKAKKLIISGNPGAALELAWELVNEETRNKLQYWVDVFNIKAPVSGKEKEFEPENAIKRVRQTLDLIEIFFKHENYIQGVTLLAAGQETFLKATVKNSFKDYVTWNEEGLFLRSKNEIQKVDKKIDKQTLINQLLLPDKVKENIKAKYYTDPSFWFKFKELEQILEWMHKIKGDQNSWYLLIWSCTTVREHDDDRRNQLMHNLRGVEKIEVIHYLLGCPEDPKVPNPEAKKIYQKYDANKTSLKPKNVVDVYSEYVQKQFLETLVCLGWDDNSLGYTPLQQELKDLANSLDAEVKQSDRTP